MKLLLNNWVRIILAAFTGALIYLYLSYSETGELPFYPEKLDEWIGGILAAEISVFALLLLDRFLSHYFPWDSRLYLRLLLSVFLGFISVYLIYSTTLAVFFYRSEYMMLEDINQYYQLMLKLGLIILTILIIYQVIHLAVHSYRLYAENELASASLRRKQIELQAATLQNQLSPHYLFNSLNTISSLVGKDTAQAEAFIRRLAQTYQYVLSTHNKELVSLGEELEFVKAYNFLLRIRFNNVIVLHMDIPEEAYERKVPPLSVQMLLENAVKHNVAHEEERLEISIRLNGEDQLTVRNNKTDKPRKTESMHVGLENIGQRYAMHSHQVSYVDGEGFYEVSLPLIP